MANAWDYVSGASTIVADNLLQAAMKAVILFGKLEAQSNKESAVQTNYASYQITGDAEKVFAATLTLPGRLTLDEVTQETKLVARNQFADYITDYEAGTGTLAGTAHLPAALVKLAELCTYWERQVNSSIVTKTPNQITVNADLEASQFTIQFNIPAAVVIDLLSGKIEINEVDYFYILRDQTV
ncbi:hypothetical protein [Chamaesiphon sp. OTE_75_metabat_556]|uniref:hypothetical protein n=1 Tax=Chamaesiphon sp. OTE_75_metabat_556 TaxID=2964692 RepID=UPI00286C6049|nr:hypothetical protein [Chamaesiphon sp. OTE_75_metabat_556]